MNTTTTTTPSPAVAALNEQIEKQIGVARQHLATANLGGDFLEAACYCHRAAAAFARAGALADFRILTIGVEREEAARLEARITEADRREAALELDAENTMKAALDKLDDCRAACPGIGGDVDASNLRHMIGGAEIAPSALRQAAQTLENLARPPIKVEAADEIAALRELADDIEKGGH